MTGFGVGGMGGLSPDISGALGVNASVGGAGLDLAASQFQMSLQMSEANNVNTSAVANRDMVFGVGKGTRDAAANFAKSIS